MLKAFFKKKFFYFKKNNIKYSYFIIIINKYNIGIGECSILHGFSPDILINYENKLHWVCKNINNNIEYIYNKIIKYPSIRFGIEQALFSLKKNSFIIFSSKFTQNKIGIEINGLIDRDSSCIKKDFKKKNKLGFKFIKIKIRKHSFDKEYKFLKFLRIKYPLIKIKVDANGSFTFQECLNILNKLYLIGIYSIEQPIPPGQWYNMAMLCKESPIPIGLDEDLINIFSLKMKKYLLDIINPKFLVLKPSFLGGFKLTNEWILQANKKKIKYCITSALESNLAISYICQWTYYLNNHYYNNLPHGFDTINLYNNDLYKPLIIKKNYIWYNYNLPILYYYNNYI